MLQRLLYLMLARKLITQTASARDAWSGLLWGMRGSESLVVVGNIFTEAAKKAHSKMGHDRPLKIVMVGRLIEIKDYSLALKVFYDMKSANGKPFSVDIYGKGPLADDLKKEVTALALDDTVAFREFEPNKDNIYSNKDFFFMCSKAEGMPNALGEAMSYGLVCLCLDFEAGPRDLLGPTCNEILPQLAESRDPEAISGQFLTLLNAKPQKLSTVGSLNQDRISEHFSPEAFSKRIDDLMIGARPHIP